MKKIFITIAIVALLGSCKKEKSTTSTSSVSTPTPTSLKTVMVVINKGGLDQFTNIRWSYTPSVDSSYNSYDNGYIRTYINTTESDSLFIYSSSRPLGGGMQMSDQITIYVNGVFKQSYSGIADFRKVYLNK